MQQPQYGQPQYGQPQYGQPQYGQPPNVQFAQPTVVVMANQPNRSELTFENKWANSLCDCCSDCGACCFAMWCPICFACKFDTAAKECCCTTVGMWCMGCHELPFIMYRTKLRSAYKISGSLWDDICLGICCQFCIWLQMYNEMKYRGDA